MKVAEIRELNGDELVQKVGTLKKELFELRMQRAEGKLTQPHRFIQVRRELAQVLTVLRQKKDSKS